VSERVLDAYKTLSTEFYELDKPCVPADEMERYWERYLAAGGPVLEPMCGSGRFLVPFAQRGADIDGVDASPHMLAACRQKAAERGLSPGLFHQFLQELELPRSYRFAFIPAGSFGLLASEDGALQGLRRLRAHLLPGAELVMEIPTLRAAARTGEPRAERRVRRPDGAEIVLARGEYRLVRDGQVLETETEHFELRRYRRPEIDTLLARAGFADSQLVADSDDGFVLACTM
jgi:SAM-dependent methyltransferase